MLDDSQSKITMLKEKYFLEIQNQISQMFKNKDFKIITFLYNVVFDKTYYQLTRVFHHSEFELNNQIAKLILYPVTEIELNNTDQLIQVIPWFLLFVIGQNLDINSCLKQDQQNQWEMFLTALAKKFNNDNSAHEYFTKFQMNLETQSNQFLSINLEETVNQIVSRKKLLELLNQIFYLDYFLFAIRSSNSKDTFFNFQLQKKAQIITNSYQFLKQRDKGITQSIIEDSKLKVGISFIEYNYNYDYLTENFHNLQAGIVIFSLIELDHKQFQNFFYSKRPSVQEQLLNQILNIADNQDNFFFNLLLVGKCLSKLRQWEYALNIYTKLQNQIKTNPYKQKFSVYIYFKICKIQFLQGQIAGLLKKLKNLNNLILQHQVKDIELYQSNNRDIYCQCLFIQLLISIYTNQTDLTKNIILQISPIIILSNQCNLKRHFSILQQELFRLAIEKEILFQGNEGNKQLGYILNKTQSKCKERQEIESNNSIFDFPNVEEKQLIEIKSYYRAIEEILIINVLVRHREICILQYLNPNFYPLLRVFLAKNNFFPLNLKSQIYFFIHDFEEAYQLAQQTKNLKMIGQILDYWGRFEDAIRSYNQIRNSSCDINLAILLKIKQDQSTFNKNGQRQSSENSEDNPIQYFQNFVQSQNEYQHMASRYVESLQQRQYSQQLSENMKEVDRDIRYTNQQQDLISQRQMVQAKSQSKDSQRIESVSHISFSLQSDQFISHLNFPIRNDIKMFYNNLKNDFRQDQHIINTLDEFVKKTHFLKCESSELFNNNVLGNRIGSGGNSQVYKFNFQGQSYAAKVISIEYMKSGDTLNLDEKSDIENKLLEICIVCDITMSKTKYCIGIEHLGLKFEEFEGEIKSYQIILITKIYNNYKELINWGETNKIKYIYKLSLGLANLQFERRLLHLDLKPENVLVDSIKKNPVIADFGFSKYSQKSQNLSSRLKKMTIKYIDPNLAYQNYLSRKNDVYSYGVSLFYYFSGCIPFEGLDILPNLGGNRQFQEYHNDAIQSIQNKLIKELIIDCTKPIADRISFVLVIKRLFMNQYVIKNVQVKQLIEILFDHIEYQQNDRKIRKINTYLKVMKSFIKYTNSFQSKDLENKVLQSYEILSSKTQIQNFVKIIQRMKQFINCQILNQHDFVLKLIDFKINCNYINQDLIQITFNFWVENAQNILSTNMILWIPFYLDIALILKQIHQYSICLLSISLDQIYLKDNQIKLNCFDYSQNLKIDDNKLYELDCTKIDPNINQSMKFSFQNDIYALFKLIEETIELMRSKLDQDKQNRVYSVLNKNDVISLEEIIGILQN